MDWSDLAGRVIGLGAPILGGALGGPLGAAAGKLLADALGAAESTPTSVHATLTERGVDSTFAFEAAQKAQSEWLAALAEIGKAQVAEVGRFADAAVVGSALVEAAERAGKAQAAEAVGALTRALKQRPSPFPTPIRLEMP